MAFSHTLGIRFLVEVTLPAARVTIESLNRIHRLHIKSLYHVVRTLIVKRLAMSGVKMRLRSTTGRPSVSCRLCLKPKFQSTRHVTTRHV